MRTLLLAAVLSTTSLCAQTTFAPVGAQWTYEQGSWAGPDTNLMVLEVLSDTIVQGRTFSKIQVNEGWFGCHEFVQYLSQSNDSLSYFDPDAEQIHLLFRWNAEIGASWSTPVEQTGYLDTLDWTVMDTSHILIDGSWLRTLDVSVGSRQWMLFSYGGTFTERLGGMGAPFTWILGFCDGETFQGLRCYSDPEITWLNPQLPQCDLITGPSDRSAPASIMVSPTIVDAGGSVHVTMPVTSSCLLIDATGLTVAALPANGDLTITHRGLYFVRATSEQGQLSVARVLVR